MARCPQAKALMRNVTNFNDRRRQVKKFRSGKKALENYFPKDFVRNEYSISTMLFFKFLVSSIIKNPLWTTLFLSEILLNRLVTIKSSKFTALHEIYTSSKKLKTSSEVNEISTEYEPSVVFLDLDDIANPLLKGGQAQATYQVGTRLAKKGWNVTVLASRFPGSKDRIQEGIKYKHIGFTTKNIRVNNAIYILVLPFYVRKIKADIIVECFTAPISTLFTPLWTKIPVVAQPTSFEAERFSKLYHLPFNLIERVGLHFYKYFLPYTEYLNEKMKKINPNVISKIVPQGVSGEYFKIRREKARYILFLGRLDKNQKGIDLLLEAYARVKNKVNYPLYIAGAGPDENKIRKLINKLDLKDRVKLIGAISAQKKFKVLSQALYVAFPSRHEGFSLFSLEALASGLPLVAFDIPALDFAGSTVAFKANTFDVEQYSELLLKAASEKLTRQMSKNCRSLAKKYTWDSVADEFEGFFLKIMQGKNLSRSNSSKQLMKLSSFNQI